MRPVLSCFLLIYLFAFCFAAGPSDLVLWFDSPATKFTQALPLGNGRLGVMVFGGVDEEKLILNESSLWSGSPQDADRPDAANYLPEIRRLLLEGKNAEAEKLVYEHFTCKGPGSGFANGKDIRYGSYQTLGSLRIRFPSNEVQVSDYRRELNLANAIARVEYRKGDVTYLREVFVSAPDQIIALRLSADKPGSIEFEAKLDRPERFNVSADGSNGLLMLGQLNNGTDGKGMKYALRLRALNKGGDVSVSDKTLRIKHADEVVLLLSAATDYMGFAGRRTPDPLSASLLDIQRAAIKNFDTLAIALFVMVRNQFS